jgi:hypothetical protein
MLRTVGEAAATRTITAATPTITAAAHHLHSAAGEATDRAATPAGDLDLRAGRAGAAEAVVEAGAGAGAAVVGAGVVRFKDGRAS